MTTFIDSGARCDNHVGEIFPPRCLACQALDAEFKSIGFNLCPRHPAHKQPCSKCETTHAA